MIPDIGLSLQMKANKFQNDFSIEEFGMFGSAGFEGIDQQLTERASQPIVRRNVEANFLACEDGGRQLVIHQLP